VACATTGIVTSEFWQSVPALGATSRFPTGQRGLYYYFRTGSDVLVQNAFRYLEVL
jgi:predicted phage gp36 major capsid-like protein